MTNNVIYKVEPKELDDNNDELELRTFTINCDYTESVGNGKTIPTADKWVSLGFDSITTGCMFCLQSDQPLSIAVTINGVVTEIMTNAYNVILKGDYKKPFSVKNISGVDANIKWKYYGD